MQIEHDKIEKGSKCKEIGLIVDEAVRVDVLIFNA